jgi:putative membrane protein
LLAASTALALGAELAGTSFGLPFGDYAYSGLLGYRILGLVPFPIPVSWFYMLVGSLAIVSRLASPGRPVSAWRWSSGAGLLMVGWDVSMDPAMVKTGHWLWGSGAMFRDRLPQWMESFFTADAFYGMPLSNWVGWFVTATLIARVMLAIVEPRHWSGKVGRSPFPVALYVVNGIMPVALCLRDELWWAAALGAVAMLVPSLLAWRGPTAHRSELEPAQASP